jgi:hypothetical protein
MTIYVLAIFSLSSYIVALSVLDSNLFSIVLHVCNLIDFAKSQVSSVRLDFICRSFEKFGE